MDVHGDKGRQADIGPATAAEIDIGLGAAVGEADKIDRESGRQWR